MTRRHIVVVVLGFHLVATWAAVATAAQPNPSTAAAPVRPRASASPTAVEAELWLRGPFGRVAGGSLAEPATAAPQDGPLDAYARGMPLQLEADDPAILADVDVLARPVDPLGVDEHLARGTAAFAGPSRSGSHVIIARLPGGGTGSPARAWLVDVPDRDLPDDGIFDLPAPTIRVGSATDQVAGTLGDGCYVYLCVETGRATPPGRLDPLGAAVEEILELEVSDGSGLVAWEGRLSPLGETRGQAREASGVITDMATPSVPLSGLEAPGPGEWLLDVEIVLDRERGWLRTAYRLVVD